MSVLGPDPTPIWPVGLLDAGLETNASHSDHFQLCSGGEAVGLAQRLRTNQLPKSAPCELAELVCVEEIEADVAHLDLVPVGHF